MYRFLRNVSAFAISIAALYGVASLYSCLSATSEESDGAAIEAKMQHKSEAMDAAKHMGISVDAYLAAVNELGTAEGLCVARAARMAKWGYEFSNRTDLSWRVDGKIITLISDDLRFKNGFGASSIVSYTCLYSMDTRAAVITSVDDQ